VVWFSLRLVSEIFLILRRIQWDIIVNVHRYSCREPVIRVSLYWNLNFLDTFLKNAHENPSSGSRVVPCGPMDRRTDRYGEINSRFSQFCKRALKPYLCFVMFFYLISCFLRFNLFIAFLFVLLFLLHTPVIWPLFCIRFADQMYLGSARLTAVNVSMA
jgi:hypothetical protein